MVKAKTFALIGAAGYVAPRHMKAIKDVGGKLIATLDPHDSVGILDSYYPECRHFTEFERFDRFLTMQPGLDYLSVCSPNYLHDAHCRLGLRLGADVICEKPLVLTYRNLVALKQAELKSKGKINTIMQLRLNRDVQRLAKSIKPMYHKVKINYVAPRGKWYSHTWKADRKKSGGVSTNIGVHLLDLLCWLFGPPFKMDTDEDETDFIGELYFKNAFVDIHLSTSRWPARRLFEVDGTMVDLSYGFETAHTVSYREILHGDGFGIDDVSNTIALCEAIRCQG